MATPYLIRRRAGYYFRVRVPVDLAPLLGTHLTRSLATRDYALARRLAIQAAAAMANVWHGARQRMGGRFVNGEWLHWTDELEDEVRRERALEAATAVEEKVGAADVTAYTQEQVAAMIAAVRAEERELAFPPPSATEVARLEGVAEGMRQAIAAGVGSVARLPAVADQPGLAEGAKRPVSNHLDALFKHQGVGEKTEEEYPFRSFRMDPKMHYRVPCVEQLGWLTALHGLDFQQVAGAHPPSHGRSMPARQPPRPSRHRKLSHQAAAGTSFQGGLVVGLRTRISRGRPEPTSAANSKKYRDGFNKILPHYCKWGTLCRCKKSGVLLASAGPQGRMATVSEHPLP